MYIKDMYIKHIYMNNIYICGWIKTYDSYFGMNIHNNNQLLPGRIWSQFAMCKSSEIHTPWIFHSNIPFKYSHRYLALHSVLFRMCTAAPPSGTAYASADGSKLRLRRRGRPGRLPLLLCRRSAGAAGARSAEPGMSGAQKEILRKRWLVGGLEHQCVIFPYLVAKKIPPSSWACSPESGFIMVFLLPDI